MMTYIALAAAAVLVGIDQLTKRLAVDYIMPQGTVNLISINDKEWLNLTYQQNTGAAFSILKDKQLFLIILTSIVILGVIILMLTKRIKKTSYIWSFALIIAGGVGNLIDRIVNGYVVDFIDVRIIKFAVFNFADICAVAGTLLIVFFYILEEVRASKEKKKKESRRDEEQA
ncbi:MAG: signal peptidase II [Bacteroides sp.]|nr:signal peptidase II [Bacteroides sp.]